MKEDELLRIVSSGPHQLENKKGILNENYIMF